LKKHQLKMYWRCLTLWQSLDDTERGDLCMIRKIGNEI
jgi:hypothetical protein